MSVQEEVMRIQKKLSKIVSSEGTVGELSMLLFLPPGVSPSALLTSPPRSFQGTDTQALDLLKTLQTLDVNLTVNSSVSLSRP